ncbi:MAG: DUF3577 domain-containing protein [Gammaproteobacteria bacterium]|nr:DUF3577 domain-containing protein [Gammaproteobacteria bacterium]
MSTKEQSKYYDLYTSGLGYLNSVKDVNPENGLPFLAVRISALRGDITALQRTHFNCVVMGLKTMDFVRQLALEVNAGKRVLIGFKLSDIHPQIFYFDSGPRVGQAGVNMRGRLIRIDWARVNGVTMEPPLAEA